jgi:serine/threonine-protein kinase HipA
VRLDVHVRGKVVAKLYRERDEYVLSYLPETDQSEFVSLTMPVRAEAWRWPRDLHPFFRQNLPEGYLLGIIREEFGPLLDGTDLSLLAVVGGMGIGRVTVTPEGGESTGDMEPLQVESLLKADNTTQHFASLVRRYARVSISGMVPKFLAPEKDVDAPIYLSGKPTLRTSRHIIKGADDNTPYLGFNEFYTMRVLERLNVVPVAKTRMSEDGGVLIVDRFDVDAQGLATHGVEDACGLLGLPPHEKYATTTERVLGATRAYLPNAMTQAQLVQFAWHVLTNYVVRNADCHAKNIALFYKGFNDVAYTPVYDLVTTQAYPRYVNNPPALPIDGRQSWVAGKNLERFFKSRLGISPKHYAEMVEQLCQSAVEVGREVIQAAKNEPRWQTVANNMVHAWNEGMASVRSSKSQIQFKGLSEAIIEAGFSAPEQLKDERAVIGRSELLGRTRT